jgi:hypothetical protein
MISDGAGAPVRGVGECASVPGALATDAEGSASTAVSADL